MNRSVLAAVALLAAAAALSVQAAPVAAPAERVAAVAALIAAPAPAGREARRTFDHPAIAARRVRLEHPLDTNAYRVQPPASVAWRAAAVAH